MSLWAKRGSFALPTSVNAAFDVTDGTIPEAGKVLFLYCSGLTANSNSTANDLEAYGMATSSTSRCTVAIADNDVADPTVSGKSLRDTACLVLLSNGTPTIDAVCDFVSFLSNGFRLNVSDAPTTAVLVHYLVLGGSDIESAQIVTFNALAGTGNQSITSVGFQGDFVQFMSGLGTATGESTTAKVSMGAARSSTERFAQDSLSVTGKTAVDCNVNRDDTKCLLTHNETASGTATNIGIADFTQFTATGFDLNWTQASPAAYKVFALVLKGANLKCKVGLLASRTGAGNFATTTGMGVPPVALLGFSNSKTGTGNANAQDDAWTFGATDGTTTSCVGGSNNDAATASQAKRLMATPFHRFQGNDGAGIVTRSDLSFTSFDSNGFTLNYTADSVATRGCIYVAFGSFVASAEIPILVQARYP